MKKTFAFLAALAFIGGASAQQSIYLQNDGRIHNVTTTYAGISGMGSVTAHAEGTANAVANGSVAALPGAIAVSGQVSGGNTGSAYVISNAPTAVGSATVDGWADSRVYGHATSVLPTGQITGSISVDGGMTDAVRNGTDLHISAGLNQDAFVNATYSGSAAVVGAIGQVAVPGGAVLTGHVADNKTADGSVIAGRITFTGTAPVGMTAANVQANTGVVVNADAAFIDPAH